ncbi:MAG: adenylyltransferase/cytidyltransferase family protein [archaeon]
MKTVLAGGVFDLWHEGHRYFLQEAKKLGDELVVVVANDASVKKKINNKQAARANIVRQQGIADRVVIGDAKDFMKTVRKIRPNVIALGYDQKNPVLESGIKVVRIKKFGDYSSSKLRKK